MLVEIFERLNAVRCAVEIQRAMVDRNAGTTEDKRITFPIGVNLGNVIADAGKNIRLPVHAYALSVAAVASLPEVTIQLQLTGPSRRNSSRFPVLLAGILAAIGIAIAVRWEWPKGNPRLYRVRR